MESAISALMPESLPTHRPHRLQQAVAKAEEAIVAVHADHVATVTAGADAPSETATTAATDLLTVTADHAVTATALLALLGTTTAQKHSYTQIYLNDARRKTGVFHIFS